MMFATRRDFLRQTMNLGAAALAAGPLSGALTLAADRPGGKMTLGLCTYLWGQDWDLPTVIANCEKTKILGVELRTGPKHRVEPTLTDQERKEVKKRFADSPVKLVGPGSAECFDHPDPARLEKAIEATKGFIKLSHDCGGSGVKVRPNDFHKDVPREKTIEQIGKSLNVVGKFGADYGQQIRLEIHGSCGAMATIKQIIDIADNPNVGLCWNCNGDELKGEGLVYHFNRLKNRFGATVHVRELSLKDYPYQDLVNLFVQMDYRGWILLECRTRPADLVEALREQREVFQKMLAKAQGA